MNDYAKRVEALKSVETICYTLCFRVLEEEKAAIEAAKLALIDLFRDEMFCKLEGEERLGRVRKRAIARSMEQWKGIGPANYRRQEAQ